jgi:hypothetical protein
VVESGGPRLHDAAYYLYVLHSLRALDGSAQAVADTERALDECRVLGRFRRDRTRSFEWIGPGEGIQRLVHQSRLGEWKENFWGATEALARLSGRIASIDGPQKGSVELPCGIDAFFVPGRAGFHFGRDENAPVTLASERWGERGMLASDLADALGAMWARWER